MACVIDQGGTFDCSDLKPGGIAPFAMTYNLDDWKSATKTLGAAGEITAITNAVAKQAYEFQAADETNIVPTTAIRKIEGGADKYDHQVIMTVFEKDQASRNNVSKTRFAPVVVIIYRNDGTGLVYGSENGMRMEEIVDNPQDPNNSDIILTLKTQATSPAESNLPIVIDAGDAASTKALIEGLTTPGV